MVAYYMSQADSVAEVLNLREHIEADLRERGIDQWHSTQAHGHEALRTWIDRRTLTAVRDRNGDLVGTIGLDGPDLDFWTEEEAQESALYVYKLMIHRDARGTGLGDALLDWAGQQARRVGAESLRLDCNRSNTSLHHYWKIRGFAQVGVREHPTRQSGALFQRPANTATSTSDVVLIPLGELSNDRYDPDGSATVWQEAANAVCKLILDQPPRGEDDWNSALTQASRSLELRSEEIRRGRGRLLRRTTVQR